MYIADLDMSKAQDIINEYQPKYPWLELIPTTDTKAAAEKSQVIITQTTSTKEFIDASWVVPGTSLVAVGAIEVDPEVVLKSDIVVVDEWNQMITNESRPVAVGQPILQHIGQGKRRKPVCLKNAGEHFRQLNSVITAAEADQRFPRKFILRRGEQFSVKTVRFDTVSIILRYRHSPSFFSKF